MPSRISSTTPMPTCRVWKPCDVVRTHASAVRGAALAGRNTRAAREMLGGYLDGSLLGTVPPMECAMRAAQALTRHGETGRARLCRALSTLGRSVRPRTTRMARRIAALLRNESKTPEIVQCLRNWRWSPGGLLSLLLPRSNDAQARGEQ